LEPIRGQLSLTQGSEARERTGRTEQSAVSFPPLDIFPLHAVRVSDEEVWPAEPLVDALTLLLKEGRAIKMALARVIEADGVKDRAC
jgi:hypothetical protein